MSTEINLSFPAATSLLEIVPANVLWGLLKAPDFPTDAFFRGGFQISRKSIQRPAVRARIARALSRDAAFAKLFLAAPGSPWAHWALVLATFDEGWLRQHWRELIRSGGGVCIAVAFAIDERPCLHRRGARVLLREKLWGTLSPADDLALRHAFAELLPSYLKDISDEPLLCSDAPGDGIGSSQEESRELLDIRQSLDSHRRKLRDAQAELRTSAAKSAARERALRGEIRAEKMKLIDLESSATQRIQNAIAEIRRSVLRIPLGLTASVRVSAKSTDELLDSATTALGRQAEVNERHGLLATMRKDLDRLTGVLGRLGESIQDSVTVLPETREVYQAVLSARQRIADSLREFRDDDVEADSLSTYLLACIRGSHLVETGALDLDKVESLLGNDLIQDFLGPDCMALLRRDLRETRAALAELKPASGSDRMTNRTREERASAPREIWDVRKAIQETSGNRVAVRLFIDGYNAIRRVEKLGALEDTAGLAAARAAFVDFCKRKADQFAGIEIVFDGVGTLSERVVDRGVTVVYSSGVAESQNADIYLSARLHALDTSDCTVWLVTDDFGLRDQVRSCCDAYIPPIHLFAYLSD